MSLTFRTTMNHKANRQEIVLAAGRVYENVSLDDPTPADKLPCYGFALIRPIHTEETWMVRSCNCSTYRSKFTQSFYRYRSRDTNLMIAKLQMIDLDVILGHNFESVDYGILLHRMKDCSTSHWSKLGRKRRTEWPKGFGRGGISWAERQIISGRLICDLSNDMGRVYTSCGEI